MYQSLISVTHGRNMSVVWPLRTAFSLSLHVRCVVETFETYTLKFASCIVNCIDKYYRPVHVSRDTVADLPDLVSA